MLACCQAAPATCRRLTIVHDLASHVHNLTSRVSWSRSNGAAHKQQPLTFWLRNRRIQLPASTCGDHSPLPPPSPENPWRLRRMICCFHRVHCPAIFQVPTAPAAPESRCHHGWRCDAAGPRVYCHVQSVVTGSRRVHRCQRHVCDACNSTHILSARFLPYKKGDREPCELLFTSSDHVWHPTANGEGRPRIT